jgi:hypothetical protein
VFLLFLVLCAPAFAHQPTFLCDCCDPVGQQYVAAVRDLLSTGTILGGDWTIDVVSIDPSAGHWIRIGTGRGAGRHD